MIDDSNSVIGFAGNLLSGITSGDMILLGILFFAGIMLVLVLAKVKASTALMVGVSVMFMFAMVASEFMIFFWLALIIALFVLINGLRKWVTGQ